jgi:hypothetical protein
MSVYFNVSKIFTCRTLGKNQGQEERHSIMDYHLRQPPDPCELRIKPDRGRSQIRELRTIVLKETCRQIHRSYRDAICHEYKYSERAVVLHFAYLAFAIGVCGVASEVVAMFRIYRPTGATFAMMWLTLDDRFVDSLASGGLPAA